MPKCFVIQPFDDGKRYDKRYNDVFAPAIRDAGLEPYRVDQDPSVKVPIDEIEKGIEDTDACLVEISTDNPNVWFELGYAIASKRDVILLCSKNERETPFPFDVQHRTIIRYSTESPSDFEKARSEITKRLKAVLSKREQLGQFASVASVSRLEGLDQYEIAGLVSVAQEVDEPAAGISSWAFRKNMKVAGFTRLAGTLALQSLLDKGMLEQFRDEDDEGIAFTAFRLTSSGMDWLFENKEKLTLQGKDEEPEPQGITDDDVPF